MQNQSKHKSVLVNEVLEYLNPQPNKIYLDVTFGCGGHTRAILEKEPNCEVVAIDWDCESIKENEPLLKKEFGERLTVLWGNFADAYKLLKKEKIFAIDGVLGDFGTSQVQIHERDGFSFMKDTPLDMRMSKSHFNLTAADILNSYPEASLYKILRDYGEDPFAKKIARAIVNFRNNEEFKTSGQLTNLVEATVPFFRSSGRRIHPATQTFQALRIAVNKELENISILLNYVIKIINPGGRIVCISFHSLEDRIVKNFFKQHSDQLQVLTPKPIIPTQDEIFANPSSRSSKLRAAQKL